MDLHKAGNITKPLPLIIEQAGTEKKASALAEQSSAFSIPAGQAFNLFSALTGNPGGIVALVGSLVASLGLGAGTRHIAARRREKGIIADARKTRDASPEDASKIWKDSNFLNSA